MHSDGPEQPYLDQRELADIRRERDEALEADAYDADSRAAWNIPTDCIVYGHSYPSDHGYCHKCGQAVVWDGKQSREVL